MSGRLLLTIFYPGTPLHDGAVIITGDRVMAAAVVLPLSSRQIIDADLGTRHLAAIGITEESDAMAIVVSEETGIVSVARNGRIVRRLDGAQLRKIVQTYFRT